jgi:eukaryotic-like serine/threonine-protein kinase
VDPPSQQLIERLRDLRLCRPGDLRRCRAIVRRLARDLPTFDSVWIDALVQTRRLTPFQARILDSADPDRLDVGPFVLLHRLGDDGRLSRYLARQKDGKTRFLLSRVRCRNDHPSAALDRLRESIHAMAGLRDRSLNPLSGCAVQDDVLTVVSPYVPGPTFAELLVRRGCFPAANVRDVAAQLTGALAVLESAELVHGDLRLQNVVLDSRGRAVLLHPGLLIAVDPELTIHADLPPDACDTVAPERIGTGAHASTSSDMYAFGCLLFALIAGRPPFPHGDPLTKLAAHQSHPVPDVRRYAPEAPDAIAELISRLTARDPHQRPASFAELARELKRHGTAGRLKRFERTFQHPVRIRRTAARPSVARRFVVPLLLLFAGVNLALLHAGARTELLSLADSFRQKIRDAVHEGPSASSSSTATEGESATALQPLPTVFADGVLTLDGPGPYAAGRLAVAGPLVVRGDSEQRTVIVVDDAPFELWAERILLENLVIRSSGFGKTPSELLTVNCQDVGLKNCVFATGGDDPGVAAMTWTALEDSSATAPRIAVVDCLFAGTDSALRLRSNPGGIQFLNVLQIVGGALVEIGGTSSTGRTISMGLQRTTLRQSRSLLQFAELPAHSMPSILLTLEDSALDLVPNRSALVLFATEPEADWYTRIRVTGQDSLVRPGTTLAARAANAGARAIPLDADRMSVDGLFAAEFSFTGDNVLNPADSRITGSHLLGHSLDPPGADVETFSLNPPSAYNSKSTQ